MILKNELCFVVSSNGEIDIENCVWDLVGITTSGQTHFYLSGGTFKCYQTVVKDFANDKLTFFYSGNSNNIVDISGLIFSNIKISVTGYHFNISGDTSVSNSVYYISFLSSVF
jgi:type II secretory pathway component PulC